MIRSGLESNIKCHHKPPLTGLCAPPAPSSSSRQSLRLLVNNEEGGK